MSQPHLTWLKSTFNASDLDTIHTRLNDLAQRLHDSSYVFKIHQLATHQSQYTFWASDQRSRSSLAWGSSGLALLYHELNRVFPDAAWKSAAQDYFAASYELLQKEEAAPGLFHGVAGLLFLAHALPEQVLAEDAEKKFFMSIASFTRKLPFLMAPHHTYYDLPQGAVGMAAMLLSVAQKRARTASPEIFLLAMLVNHLVWVGQQTDFATASRSQQWYATPDLQRHLVSWKHAYKGYGMRAGLAGHIALLSLVLTSGLELPVGDVQETLQALCQRLQRAVHKHEGEWSWPQEETGDNGHRPGNIASFAWCDGTSGIARSLWLAGQALQDTTLSTFALECIAAACTRCCQELHLVSPSLCHGLSGMIQVCARFASDTGDAVITSALTVMVERLLEQFEADRPFGYRAYEPEFIRVDMPWLLEGAAGVALTLLSLLSPQPPLWDRLLLLA